VKIVFDTIVFVSGVFFGGPPGTILEAWQNERVELTLSLEIFSEFERVGKELGDKYREVELSPFLALIAMNAEICDCPPLDEQVCEDADDDKFFACALATGAPSVVSGDKLLLKTSGYRGIEVIRPREFVDRFLAIPPPTIDT
jgi:uncharacterized protein